MPPFLQDSLNKLTAFWSDRSMAQRVMIGGLAASLVVIFLLLIIWLNQPDYKILYSNLPPEDAGRVAEQLKKQKIDYKLEDSGKTVLVPSDQVYQLRLDMAGEGLLHGTGLGFELFDEVKIGQTDFVQRINYQRALQGELSRTITEFPEIERARVHIVMPHKSLFIEEQSPPTASIILKLAEGRELNQKQIEAIVNLVSLSVEGLDKSQITVADVAGKLLFQADSDDSVKGLTLGQLEYRTTLQRNLEQRIEQLLTPVVGVGKVIARVNADVDFSQKTITKDIYDPSSAVVRSEQRTEEQTKGRANIEGGEPDPNFRGDGFNGSLSSQDSNRETRTTNFEINKEQQSIVVPVGEIDRLSVAVIVDGTWQAPAEGEGEPVWVPRSQEEIQRITELVRNTVGFSQSRGDAIEVSNISFGEPDMFGEPSLMQTMLEYMQRLGKPILNGLLIFLFLLLIVRPVVLSLIKPKVAAEEIEELISLPEADERLALEEGVQDEVLDLNRRLELAKAQALQLAEKDMDQAVAVLKTWLKQEAA
ncbi:flagellar basal-body MS-ring/collar protein FliF [Desulfocurvibacter africanus]|uniref:Flagellar M-ring protein n=1 Tax=Desulfocurvibacter africanus PCS TaxID=1262666 RepID=M5Q2W6_DESAF|nr:flagellar basal-body MS-ring/collar protein FliF [Desulfocurvibacter africanus]EMG37758.1 flagellar basal-body M-ring protein/flagellar hook-basal body protein FliF [Desulfocurvibacter africanus PCS]